jgi:hypothetical protein
MTVKFVYKKQKRGYRWDTIGKQNRVSIYDLLSEHPGQSPHQIKNALNITRQTVQTHLKELSQERKVYKRNHKYFINDEILENIVIFARDMKQASATLFDPLQIYESWSNSENSPTNLDEYNADDLWLQKSIRSFLDNHVSVLSQKHCKTKFRSDEMYERYLFELANRIGAYLMYIFIEAMKPPSEYNTPSIGPEKKEELSRGLIARSIDVQMMFEKFCGSRILFGLAHHKHEFTNDTFDKITGAFKKVYPVVYNALEQYWEDSINMSIKMENALISEEKTSDHKHTWKEYSIYKLKNRKYLICRVCRRFVDEKTKNRITNQRNLKAES